MFLTEFECISIWVGQVAQWQIVKSAQKDTQNTKMKGNDDYKNEHIRDLENITRRALTINAGKVFQIGMTSKKKE